MKRTFFVLFFLCLSISSAVAEGKSLIRVSGLSDAEMKIFLHGDFDMTRRGKDFFEAVVSPEEVEVFHKTHFKTVTLIPDLDAYIAQRMTEQTAGAAYFTYDTMCAQLKAWADSFPGIARVSSIGKSVEGRDIWAVKVSDNPDQDEREPACLFMGAHHAREWISMEVTMATLKTLLEGYGKDERLTQMVDEREIWFVPMVNPDGVTYSQTSYKYWRKNRRPLGQYFGVDLNRNYGYHWNPSSTSSAYSETFPGTAAFSEPEVAAIKTLAEEVHPQSSIAFHSYSELILFPFAYDYDVPNPDLAVFQQVGKEMAEFNGYTVQNCTELYPAAGISDDWLYGDLKTIAFTIEIGREFIPPASEIAGINAVIVPSALRLIERTAAIAVTAPSGQETFIASLALNDGLDAYSLGRALNPKLSGEARERLSSRMDRVSRRIARLAADQLAIGNRTPLDRVLSTQGHQGIIAYLRSCVRFDLAHGVTFSPDLLAELEIRP